MDKSATGPEPFKTALKKTAKSPAGSKKSLENESPKAAPKFSATTSPSKPKTSATKSASNVHHSASPQHKLESVRPSASALLRRAQSDGNDPTPVVRTSLKLAPKKPPVVAKTPAAAAIQAAASATIQDIAATKVTVHRRPVRATAAAPAGYRRRDAATILPTKGQTKINSSYHSLQGSQSPADSFSPRPAQSPIPRPAPSGRRVFQDVIRPAAPRPASEPGYPAADPELTYPAPDSELAYSEVASERGNRRRSFEPSPAPGARSVAEHPKRVAPTSKEARASAPDSQLGSARPSFHPLDSLKNRFRPAPKGYATSSAAEARATRPYGIEDFLNPSHPSKATPGYNDTIAPEKEAVHIYGMSDMPEPHSETPYWVHNDTDDASSRDSGYGIIEDYHRADGRPTPVDPSASTTITAHATPDNNRYVLGARSPFFLESVDVEKRPLSALDDPSVPSGDPENPIYSTQDLSDSPKKNLYEKKSPKSSSSSSPSYVQEILESAKSPVKSSTSLKSTPYAADFDSTKTSLSAASKSTSVSFKSSTTSESSKSASSEPSKSQKSSASTAESSKPSTSAKPARKPSIIKAPGSKLLEVKAAKSASAAKSTPSSKPTKASKSSKSSRARRSSPTVIVPTRRRSHAPLFGLLILTVILGSIVGALIYLCFFQ